MAPCCTISQLSASSPYCPPLGEIPTCYRCFNMPSSPSSLCILHMLFLWLSSLVTQMVKNLSAMQETPVWSLGREDPLEKKMATHSSILVWRIPWTEDPGGLQLMGSQRVGHDWATNTFTSSDWKHPPLPSFILSSTFPSVQILSPSSDITSLFGSSRPSLRLLCWLAVLCTNLH